MHLRPRRPRRALAIAAATVMASTAVVFAAGGTALANASNCVWDNSSDTVLICGAMNGTGLHVNTAFANAGVYVGDKQGYILQACLHGPRGGIVCTPFEYIAPGGEIQANWAPNATEPAGQYCANIWVKPNFNSGDSLLGQVCWSVHS